VGATDETDTITWFSNFGPCVSLLAPGLNIVSLGINGAPTATLSGTSMSAPLVAGSAALVIDKHGKHFSVAQVRQALIDAASTGVVGGLSEDTPNRLVYSRPGGDD
jgi:subtilisin family serine protease